MLDLELHEVAMGKRDRHAAADLGYLWEVVQRFQKQQLPLPGDGATESKQVAFLEDLENSQYELLKKQLEFDRKTFREFESASWDAKNHLHHVRMKHEKEVRARRSGIVQKFIDGRIHVQVYSAAKELVAEFERYRNCARIGPIHG